LKGVAVVLDREEGGREDEKGEEEEEGA